MATNPEVTPDAEPAAGETGAEPASGSEPSAITAAPATAGRPWHADPVFMAGVAVSVLVILAVATRPRGCKDCREKARMAAELAAAQAAVDLPEPGMRAAAEPPQQPGPGVAAQPEVPRETAAPTVEETHVQLAAVALPTLPQPGVTPAAAATNGHVAHAFDPGARKCSKIEWCALPTEHDGPCLAAARKPLTPAELAALAPQPTAPAGP